MSLHQRELTAMLATLTIDAQVIADEAVKCVMEAVPHDVLHLSPQDAMDCAAFKAVLLTMNHVRACAAVLDSRKAAES